MKKCFKTLLCAIFTGMLISASSVVWAEEIEYQPRDSFITESELDLYLDFWGDGWINYPELLMLLGNEFTEDQAYKLVEEYLLTYSDEAMGWGEGAEGTEEDLPPLTEFDLYEEDSYEGEVDPTGFYP